MEKSEYSVTAVKPPDLQAADQVKVTVAGDVTHIRYMNMHPSGGQRVQRVSKTEYVNVKTGEVKEYKEAAETRADNLPYLRRTMAQFRDMLNANVRQDNRDSCLWLTLTYRPNEDGTIMDDETQLCPDVKAYVKRMHRRFGNFEYLMACEPHASGQWHIHMLLIFPGKAPYIRNDDMAKVWQHGYTKTKKLPPADVNIGAYLSAYLTDMDVSEDKAPQGDENAPKTRAKRIEKGMRLYFYPAGFRPYRWSKGCIQPTTYTSSYGKEKNDLKDATLKAVYTHEIKVPTINTALIIHDEYYTTAKPTSQEVKVTKNKH